MSQLQSIEVPVLPTVSAKLDPKGSLTLEGEMATRDPAETMSLFFHDIHRALVADGFKEFTLNVVGLVFVNSSGIRLFINWVTWARQTPEHGRYNLIIRMDQKVTWQRTSLAVLRALAPGVVTLDPVD